VLGGKAFVPKITVDLVYPLQPTDHEPLQVQLRCDPQIQIDIQRVVMRHEGARRRAAVKRLHHWRLHLYESPSFQLPPQRGDEPGAGHKDFTHFRVGDQIEVALPVACFHVLQAVPFLRHREQRLGEKLDLLHVHAELPGAGTEQVAIHAHDVAVIEHLEKLKAALTHGVLLDVNLQPLAVLLQVRESRLAHEPLRHHPAGHANAGRALRRPQFFGAFRSGFRQDLGNRVCEIEAPAVRLVTKRFDFAGAAQTLSQQFVF